MVGRGRMAEGRRWSWAMTDLGASPSQRHIAVDVIKKGSCVEAEATKNGTPLLRKLFVTARGLVVMLLGWETRKSLGSVKPRRANSRI